MWHRLQTYALGIVLLVMGVTVAMVLASVTTALLMLRDTSAPVAATPHAAGPSYQAAGRQFPPGLAEATQRPAARSPGEPAARYQGPDDPTADHMFASEMPWVGTSPAPGPGVPRGSEDLQPGASGQDIFALRGEARVGSAAEQASAPSSAVERPPAVKSSTPTKALETVDPRELLRQARLPK